LKIKIDFEKWYKSINNASFFVITYEIIDSTFIDIVLASCLTLKKTSSFFMKESGERLGLIFAIFSLFLILLKLFIEVYLSRDMYWIQRGILRLKKEFKPRQLDHNGNEIIEEEQKGEEEQKEEDSELKNGEI